MKSETSRFTLSAFLISGVIEEYSSVPDLISSDKSPLLGLNFLLNMREGKSNPDGYTASATIRVRYAETDQMGFAYYANYLVWFEVGRNQYCNDCGFSYRDMERETGLFLIVAESYCRYKTPARYEDELIVRTRISELTRRTIRFTYEIERSDGVTLATGETLHVLTTPQGRPSSMPEKYRLLLAAGGLTEKSRN
jgi:acyl-CoA thioester hydrolase